MEDDLFIHLRSEMGLSFKSPMTFLVTHFDADIYEPPSEAKKRWYKLADKYEHNLRRRLLLKKRLVAIPLIVIQFCIVSFIAVLIEMFAHAEILPIMMGVMSYYIGEMIWMKVDESFGYDFYIRYNEPFSRRKKKR